MKKDVLKKLSVFLLAMVMVLAVAGCGGDKGEGDAPKDGDSGKAKVLTEEEYIAEIDRIGAEIQTKVVDPQATIDATDAAAATEKLTAIIKDGKDLYGQLGNLSAPDKYKDAQAKIKTGSEASVKLLDISAEMLGFQADPSKADPERVKEIQTEMMDLATAAQDLTVGMTMIQEAQAAE